MDITLRGLRALVMVTRLRSFTRAATFLHISQPALTVQIRRLEESLGLRLLDRNPRGVSLTPAGEGFVPILERILAEIDAVTLEAKEVSDRRRGTVTLAAVPSAAFALVPTAISTFKREHPGITVRLRDVTGVQVGVLVKSGEVDFGIMTPPHGDAELVATPLFVDRLSAVFLPGHPFNGRRRITMDQLRRVPLILQRDSSVRKLVDDAFESLGTIARPAYEATLLPTALALVKAGLGVAVVSSTSARGARLAGLRVRTVADAGLIRHIGVVRKTGRSLSPAAEQFVALLQRLCKTSRA